MSFSDHFSDRASAYAKFRPTYPPEMIEWIARVAPATARAWDCATGNGQAAVLLARHFTEVIATDASEEQLRAATPHPRIRYHAATERDSGIHTASVDLVTVAQALHWFDIPAFYVEVGRVLRPRGVLAVWSYGKPSVEGDANAVLHWFHDVRVGPYWPSERLDVENGYQSVTLPYPEIPAGARTLTASLTRDAVIGYVGTWSAVRQARLKQHRDPIPEFESRLAVAWPEATAPRVVSWPLTVRVCRRGPS